MTDINILVAKATASFPNVREKHNLFGVLALTTFTNIPLDTLMKQHIKLDPLLFGRSD